MMATVQDARATAGYFCAVRAAAAREVGRGFLLAPDAERLMREAEASDVLAGIEPSRDGRVFADRLCAR